jgi:hypothetical protein
MDSVVNKYVWQFSLFYFIGCLIGFPLMVLIDTTWNLHLHDVILIVSLAAAIPFLTCDKFIKNEGRFFTPDEQQFFIKKSAKIATMIGVIPTLLTLGTTLFIKLFAPPEIVAHFAAQHSLEPLSVNSPVLITIILCTTALYYIFIRLSLGGTVKSIRKKYEKALKIN